MRTGELDVPAEAAGRRLDVWLADALAECSRAAAAALIDSGAVLVGGEPRPKSYRLRGGEQVTVAAHEQPSAPLPAPPEPRIAQENDDLLIVDKPPGLVVHPAPGHRGVTLVELLAERAGEAWTPYAVHRLDRDTSGLMLIAKREAVRDELQQLIQARKVEREYLALARGRLGSRTGTIEAPLGRSPRDRTRMSVGGAGQRDARTHFEVVRFLDGYTLVRAWLDTGRTHQIRAHFTAIGHPLAGDRAYGGPAALGLRRQFLHSARLAFGYSGEPAPIEAASPLPADLAGALARAESEPA